MTQSPSLIGWLTVAENVALPLQLLRRPNLTVAKLTETTLAQFDLDALAGKLPEQISGGEAQRVSLVRATITNPKLLLADEPTGQLDHATAQRLIDLLLTWTERTGAAVVLATHDRDVADRLDHVFTMSHGHMGNESGEGAL
jgi:putative ABC transport system ATP-binding protein/lipoprotein-releasing system ATP-binding protein